MTTIERMERINRRCEILISLGFVIAHMDVSVGHPATPEITFDFSSTADDMFIHQALKTVRYVSFIEGRNSLRAEINKLQTPEEISS